MATHSPVQASNIVGKVVRGTNMEKQPNFYGDNVTIGKKRAPHTVTIEEGNSSHRPEYLTQNVPRNRKGRRLDFGDVGKLEEVEVKRTVRAGPKQS